MVNVFSDSIGKGPGNLQVVKKVVVTEGTFKDYSDEIQQSYELGLPYKVHKNAYCTFVTPIRVYDGKVPYRLNVRRPKVTIFWLSDESFDRRNKVPTKI